MVFSYIKEREKVDRATDSEPLREEGDAEGNGRDQAVERLDKALGLTKEDLSRSVFELRGDKLVTPI